VFMPKCCRPAPSTKVPITKIPAAPRKPLESNGTAASFYYDLWIYTKDDAYESVSENAIRMPLHYLRRAGTCSNHASSCITKNQDGIRIAVFRRCISVIRICVRFRSRIRRRSHSRPQPFTDLPQLCRGLRRREHQHQACSGIILSFNNSRAWTIEYRSGSVRRKP
jgi:hypothetical protein